MVYEWVVYAHIGSALLFMLSHGTAAGMGFRLRKETDLTRIGALLDLSAHSYVALSLSLIAVLATGLTLGALGDWWGFGWFWSSLALFLIISGVMTPLTSIPYNRVRNALKLKMPAFVRRIPWEGGEPTAEDVRKMLNKAYPEIAALVGIVGILIILWLMTFKPF